MNEKCLFKLKHPLSIFLKKAVSMLAETAFLMKITQRVF